ncbi:MAG: hypothetical protein LBO69_03890 [Ignavibacteria bacterium]|jgi:hypothetical protein|nr:hypothetical protein [Ignavibacteria bacterium]
MKINSYSSNSYVPQPQSDKSEKATNNYVSNDAAPIDHHIGGDTLDLSNETMKMKTIQGRIKSGFYDKADVMKQVASKMLKDINTDINAKDVDKTV